MTTRSDFRPGMVVERRERFIVRRDTYPPEGHQHAQPAGRAHRNGVPKLAPAGGEWVVTRGRWFVRHVPARIFLGTSVSAYWVAGEGPNDIDQSKDVEWATFATHAEAIAWADRKARGR